MTSRDRKFNRTLRAIARHNARLGKRPARELDPREDRSNHAALTRWGKKQLAKRRAKIAESVRRALRPAKKRDGGKDDFGARLIERVGSIPRDVDLGFDSENSDAAIEKSRLVMDMLELLRAIRGNMTTKADFAAMRKDIRSFPAILNHPPLPGFSRRSVFRFREAVWSL
jgi:hypothetical protein